jgi:hypothetical protein
MHEKYQPWITVYGGGAFSLEAPTPEMFDLEAIAHALSNLCRFTGHTRKFYSVAQHCVLVSKVLDQYNDPYISYVGLMHDSGEAYVGDRSRPLKALIPQLVEVERGIYARLALKYGLPQELPLEVKDADNQLLLTVQRDVMWAPVNSKLVWPSKRSDGLELTPLPDIIVPMLPEEAKKAFLDRYAELQGEKFITRS